MSTSIDRIAEIYPDDALRIVAYAPESALAGIHEKNAVDVICQNIETMAALVAGIVERISRIPDPDGYGPESQYAACIRVSDASTFYYSMNVPVMTK